ncbi:ATP-binding protein [Polaribacter sp. Z014]|uniref:AAA family ATPase n=1 Tax=Polaribacter sp. Z014 TaxID=2927126 RepID=UPI0020209F60|nr:AAA family ATPase [Polaribacter sp. Z014]MCL7762664.1 ATP-binding protein [Polaribacter sp. Z014]
MRLVAIYIPKLALTHLFGENHDGITINLGGNYTYKFSELGNSIKLIEKLENKHFIKSFWSKDISLISTIVGANGTGKTSILRTLIQELNSNPPLRNCVLIYEKEDTIQILNETTLVLEQSEIEYESIKKSEINESILYYSPNLDYDLQEINSSINLANYHRDDFQNYYLGNIRRHLFFLKNEGLTKVLKKNYPDFPSYDKIRIKAKSLYKSDFEKIYIQSTLGNKLYKIRNLLLDKTKNNLEKSITLNEDKIEEIFSKNGTIQDELKALWDSYVFKDDKKSQYLHDDKDFFKNIEINILTYLILKDSFALDGDYGYYPLDKILNDNSFKEKLTHFLHKFIIQTSELAYNYLKRKDIKIDLDNLISIKLELKNFSNINMSFGGISNEKKAHNVLKQIELIQSAYNFYYSLTILAKNKYCSIIDGGFEFDIKNGDYKLFNKLLDHYEELISNVKIDRLNSILEIKPNKKLSTGEKSLIDLYSSIYDYLIRYNKTPYLYSENCILLLDEPEQGYHPLWKKKFTNAIISTLPEVFKVNSIITGIQIIFTTHDPLTLSDIPKENIVYLNKDVNNQTVISDSSIKKSFGANITDLLADSFFVEDGLIGEFSKMKIENTIKWLNENKDPVKRSIDFSKEIEFHKKVIAIIDEPIMRIKLSEMLDELVDVKEFQKAMLQKEINFLIERKKTL